MHLNLPKTLVGCSLHTSNTQVPIALCSFPSCLPAADVLDSTSYMQDAPFMLCAYFDETWFCVLPCRKGSTRNQAGQAGMGSPRSL